MSTLIIDLISTALGNTEGLGKIIAFVATATGTGGLLSKIFNTKAKLKEEEILVEAPPELREKIETKKTLKVENNIKRLRFFAKTLFLFMILFHVFAFFGMWLFRTDEEFAQNVFLSIFALDVLVIVIWISRIVSSAYTFDVMIKGLLNIKKILKK